MGDEQGNEQFMQVFLLGERGREGEREGVSQRKFRDVRLPKEKEKREKRLLW